MIEGAIFIAAGEEVHDIVAGTHFFLGGDNRLQISQQSFVRASPAQDTEKLIKSEVPAMQVNPVLDFEQNTSPNQTPTTPDPDPSRPGAHNNY